MPMAAPPVPTKNSVRVPDGICDGVLSRASGARLRVWRRGFGIAAGCRSAHIWRLTGQEASLAIARSKSGGAAFVMVMQPADVRDLNDRAAGWRLHPARDRRVFL